MRDGLAIVVMGVTGVGKTTVGRRLAADLRCAFLEGDDFHPRANVEKMRAGVPLDAADRLPWLLAIRTAVAGRIARGEVVVVACSALKRSYRQTLACGKGRVVFACLDGPRSLVAARMAERPGHFMPVGLLDSQYAALELPDDLGFASDREPALIAAAIRAELIARGLLSPGLTAG